MCACRQNKSFLIDDILKDKRVPNAEATNKKYELCKVFDGKTNVVDSKEVKHERLSVDLSHRGSYPLCPLPVKSLGWPPFPLEPRHTFGIFADNLTSEQIFRNQLAANRYLASPFVRHPYGLDRAWCHSWWGGLAGARRKGGQVRFTTAQTGALERRFNASKYLSPDERRALAATLRLSDRQVKTWFQNRRAKWRRTTPDAADQGSPPTADDNSDVDDIDVADDEDDSR